MGLTYNGTSIATVKYNNIDLSKITYNGVVVWESGDPYLSQPLCFTAKAANSTITLTNYIRSGYTVAWAGYYSTDGTNWTAYTPENWVSGQTAYTNTVTLANIGDTVYFKGVQSADYSSYAYPKFVGTGNLAVSGNIMSMTDGDNFASATTITYMYAFYSLFEELGALTDASNLRLPATTLNSGCYNFLFYACSGLTSIGFVLPVTALASSCYLAMFRECTALTTIPTLPATTLELSCYRQMFRGCTALKFSETQTSECPNAYRIPWTGTGVEATSWNANMFYGTSGTFTSDPTINTTYYTNATVVGGD